MSSRDWSRPCGVRQCVGLVVRPVVISGVELPEAPTLLHRPGKAFPVGATLNCCHGIDLGRYWSLLPVAAKLPQEPFDFRLPGLLVDLRQVTTGPGAPTRNGLLANPWAATSRGALRATSRAAPRIVYSGRQSSFREAPRLGRQTTGHSRTTGPEWPIRRRQRGLPLAMPK